MAYQVLARKYRPSNFDELIGQEVLVQTLTNAIANNKIAHAFILTGIRGIGKTTTARIIAKALNCLGENNDAKEAGIPCGVCDSCTSIAKSSHPDVIEIDAASKTGVDDIRVIIDSVQYSPAKGRYKIFIIDEVHMLSTNAFNALLKTLEEPPAHVKFIFATTEIRKVPITVLSRCQRFDLRRLDTAELAAHLKNILAKENFSAEDLALNLIADAAEGSVRDMLSITDRILSHSNYAPELKADITAEVLGLNDQNQIIDFLEVILKGDVNGAIAALGKFYQNSTDIAALLTDLQKITHHVILTKTTNHKLDSFASNSAQKIKNLAEKTSLADLIQIWQMLLKGSAEVAAAASQKMVMEILLVRMCYLSDIANLQKVLADGSSIETKSQNSNKNLAENSQSNQDPTGGLVGEVMRNFAGSKIV